MSDTSHADHTDGELPPGPVEVPWESLPSEQLAALVESFVLREGTDYGPGEFALVDKVAAVLRQLRRGEARIVWDPGSETGTIVTADTLRRG